MTFLKRSLTILKFTLLDRELAYIIPRVRGLSLSWCTNARVESRVSEPVARSRFSADSFRPFMADGQVVRRGGLQPYQFSPGLASVVTTSFG